MPHDIPALRTDEAFPVPNLGLAVHLPEHSLVDLSKLEGGRTTLVITPQGPVRTFVFQITQSISADPNLSLREAIDNIIAQRRQFHTGRDARGKAVSLLRVFDREQDLVIGRHPVERAYLDVPADPTVVVTGYTLFHTGPGQFVIFQMDSPVEYFPRVRTLYELMVASVEFKAPEELGADRAAGLLAGESLLAGFNSADLDAVLDPEPVYYRLYRPAVLAGQADEEVGYQRIRIHAGTSADLEHRRGRPVGDTGEDRPGYIARVDARAIVMGAVVDSVSLHYLSRDREHELWSITMVVRKGRQAEEWIETGIRRGGRLTVKTTRTGAQPTNAEWSPLPRGYLSRVEGYLLPRLVARSGTPGMFGFYSYESSLAKITLRRDTFEQQPGGPWTQTTLPSENSRAVTTILDARGRIIRRAMPDGQVMEPMDPKDLRRIWMEKKLPLE